MARRLYELVRTLDDIDITYNVCIVPIAIRVDETGIACRSGWIEECFLVA